MGRAEIRSPAILGRVRTNLAPWPGDPQASNSPLWRRASSKAIESPSPVPPRILALEGSAPH